MSKASQFANFLCSIVILGRLCLGRQSMKKPLSRRRKKPKGSSRDLSANGKGLGAGVKLSETPYDVVVHVACFLSAREIARVSMLCRSLKVDLYDNKVVWVRALQQFIDEENIAKFSYDPEKMTIGEIKKVLSRPWRLRQTVIGNKPFMLSRRIVGLDYGPSLGPKLQWGKDYHRTSLLLPGGRWLLTTACDDRSLHIFCWDLHQKAEGKPLEYMTRTSFDDFLVFQDGPSLGRRGEGVTLEAQSSEEGEEIRLLTVYEGVVSGQRSTVFHMSTIKWLEEDGARPTITPTFSLTLDNSAQIAPSYVFEGEVVCVHQPVSPNIIAWNWRTNHVANTPILWAGRYIHGSVMPLKFWLRPPYAIIANPTLDRFSFLQLPLPEYESSPPSFEIVKPNTHSIVNSDGGSVRVISLLAETGLWKTLPMRGDSWVYCRTHDSEEDHGYSVIRPGPFDDLVKIQESAAQKVPLSRATKHLAKRFGAASGSNASLPQSSGPGMHSHSHPRPHSPVAGQLHSHSHSHSHSQTLSPSHSNRGTTSSADVDWVGTEPIRQEVRDNARYGLQFDYLGLKTDLFFTRIYSTGTQGEFRMSAMNVAEKDTGLDPYVGASIESIVDGVGVGMGYFEVGCSPCALSGTFVSNTTNKWNEALKMPKCVLFYFD